MMDRGYDLPGQDMEQTAEQSPEAALAEQMEAKLNDARKGAEWNRMQAEKHVAMAEEAERIVKACSAALDVLNPPKTILNDVASSAGQMARY
jgi:hypothetical protein